MKKLHLQVLLMIIAIAGITGFQLFWLKQTYEQEKRSLEIKTDLAFRDAIQQLQVVKLKLDSVPGDTAKIAKLKMLVTDNAVDEQLKVRFDEKKGIVSTINVIRRKMNDSLLKDPRFKKGVFISNKTTTFDVKASGRDFPNGDHIFSILYGVDSLQDSIKISEIKVALSKILKQRKIDVPFGITRQPGKPGPEAEAMNEVTIGFAHPVTYKLKPGNRFSYLIKQVSLPVLFSVLLLGITILSFVLLYRNLLKQRRLTEIKNEFISNITHELKTPIATVSVAIEAMKNFNALQNPERTQEYLDISTNELQRLSLLVDKVLSLSKFQKNEIEIKKEKFDLLQLIKEVLESLKPQFEKQHAAVTVETGGNNFMIEADERHISSVIYNLLDNALKYSKEDPKIDIQLIDRSQYIELRVSDNGIGIAEEYKKKIFNQFFRVPHGDKHNTKGYGLGLSYVNYIVKRHQGFIEVESELGKGSVFSVKLPFAEAPVIYYDKGKKITKENRL